MAGSAESIAVIGGGIAGQTLCEALRERDSDVGYLYGRAHRVPREAMDSAATPAATGLTAPAAELATTGA